MEFLKSISKGLTDAADSAQNAMYTIELEKLRMEKQSITTEFTKIQQKHALYPVIYPIEKTELIQILKYLNEKKMEYTVKITELSDTNKQLYLRPVYDNMILQFNTMITAVTQQLEALNKSIGVMDDIQFNLEKEYFENELQKIDQRVEVIKGIFKDRSLKKEEQQNISQVDSSKETNKSSDHYESHTEDVKEEGDEDGKESDSTWREAAAAGDNETDSINVAHVSARSLEL